MRCNDVTTNYFVVVDGRELVLANLVCRHIFNQLPIAKLFLSESV